MRKYEKWFIPALLLLAIYFPLFLNLDVHPLHIWDESLRAIQAIELHDHDNWLVPTYGGETSPWHSKPPLFMWLQALCMYVLGYNELAVRLPSALAGLATCALLYFIAARELRSPLTGVSAVLILVCSLGFTGYHGARSGDIDALLALWTTGFCWAVFGLVKSEDEHGRRPYAIALGICLTLAVLTKGVQGLMLGPGLALFVLCSGRTSKLFRSRTLWLTLGGVTGAVLAYYLAREAYCPGFLYAVGKNELWGRFNRVINENTGPVWGYLQWAWESRFRPWAWLALPYLALLARGLFRPEDRLLHHWLLWPAAGYLLLISISETKLEWYDLPLYPLLALGMAWTMFRPALLWMAQQGRAWAAAGLVACMGLPYGLTFERVYVNEGTNWHAMHYRSFFRHMQAQYPDVCRVHAILPGHNPSVTFYVNLYAKQDKPLEIIPAIYDPQYLETNQLPNLSVGACVVTADYWIEEDFRKRYEAELLDEWNRDWPPENTFRLWRVIGQKP